MSGIPIAEENVTKGGTNPPAKGNARPPAPKGSGGVMAKIDESAGLREPAIVEARITACDLVEMILPSLHESFTKQQAFLRKELEAAFSNLPPARTEVLSAGITYRLDLSDLPALKGKVRGIIEKTLNAHAVPVHRDVMYYLTDAIAEAFYVPPPVKPEDVVGVG